MKFILIALFGTLFQFASDPGAKCIRDLLRNSDEQRRTILVDYIEFTYRTYPGRSFRKDDFPDEFQKNS